MEIVITLFIKLSINRVYNVGVLQLVAATFVNEFSSMSLKYGRHVC